MNLFEFHVPSFVEHVTDDLLDEILTTGKWVHHGGDVQDQWDGGVYEYVLEKTHPEMIGRPFEEVRHTPEFREATRNLLLHMAEEQYNDLVNGSKYNKTDPLSGETLIYRGVTANEINQEAGVYWSQDKDQSLHRFVDEHKGGYLMVAALKDVTIDWEATIRSRLDLAHGGDEQEIQLLKGSPVRCRVFRVDFVKGRPVLSDYQNLVA